MTIREVQTLLLLYRAADAEARRKALATLPELGELVALCHCPEPTAAPRAERYRLTAYVDGVCLGGKNVVCRADDLQAHMGDYRASYDLATNVVVEAERV